MVLGRGIAKRAVKEAMRVVIADIKVESLSHAEKKWNSLGENLLSVVTDVSKSKDIEILVQKILDTFGEVHLLFNNAGVGKRDILWEL